MWFRFILLAVFAHLSYQAGVTLDSSKTQCACGGVNRKTRVVGGQETEPGEYPYMVEVKEVYITSEIEKIKDLCGGALISKDYCLTAAHCFVRITNIRQLLVYLGDHDSTKTTEINYSIIRSVIALTKHPNYNQTTQANDIAVVKLNASVAFQWNIQPICIPPPNMNFFQQELTITGWGATEAAGASSPVLREVAIPVIPNTDCKKMYSGTVGVIDNSVCCAGTPDGSKDACQGDSGGPAAWKCPDTGDYSLGGIVSYGIGCGNPQYAGVFTNVSYFRSWILQNTPGNVLCGSDCYPSQAVTDCGWANETPPRKKRVVGGTDTTANKYPWVVSIYILMNSAYTFVGAGSVISSNWILTTAKLVNNVSVNNMFMVVGDYNLAKLNETGEKEVYAERIVIHPNYNNPLLANDIALIKLTETLVFNDYVKPVCLPSNTALSSTFSNVYVKFAGWGRTSTAGAFATILKEVWLYAISNDQCKLKYGTSIVDSMVCTASNTQGDACDGDNGGPLMLQGQSGRWYAVALQAFRSSQGCASGNPSGNTRTNPYLPWIQSVCGVLPANTQDRLPI